MAELESQLTALAEAAQGGDKDAFGEIFDLMSPPIYRFLASRLSDPATAQDILGQVFLEAWQSLPRYNTKRPFKTWIYTIARYRLIDYFRRYRSTVSLEAVTERSATTDLEEESAVRSEFDSVLLALSDLPEMYQTVLRLKYIEELDYSEIAQVTGKSEASLRVIVKRGLDKLKISIKNI